MTYLLKLSRNVSNFVGGGRRVKQKNQKKSNKKKKNNKVQNVYNKIKSRRVSVKKILSLTKKIEKCKKCGNRRNNNCSICKNQRGGSKNINNDIEKDLNKLTSRQRLKLFVKLLKSK